MLNVKILTLLYHFAYCLAFVTKLFIFVDIRHDQIDFRLKSISSPIRFVSNGDLHLYFMHFNGLQ